MATIVNNTPNNNTGQLRASTEPVKIGSTNEAKKTAEKLVKFEEKAL